MLNTSTEVHNQNGSALAASKQRAAPTRGDPPKDKQWCDHCHKPYHTKETCWKIHGKPENWKGRNQKKQQTAYAVDAEEGKGTNFTLIPEQLKVLQQVLNQTRVTKPSDSVEVPNPTAYHVKQGNFCNCYLSKMLNSFPCGY